MHLHHLPVDLRVLILHHLAELRHLAVRCVQTRWRGYRVRLLHERFVYLRYLRGFREWNPSAGDFFRRARL